VVGSHCGTEARAKGQYLVPLVRAWAVDGWDFGFVEAQVDGELAAVMCHVAQSSVGNHFVTRPFCEDILAHEKSPGPFKCASVVF